MSEAVSTKCEVHPDRFDCPDALLVFHARDGTYGLIIHDGGSAKMQIAFCPFCGAALP